MNWKAAAKKYAGIVRDPMKLVRMHFENGVLHGAFSGFGIKLIAQSLASWFVENKGTNFVTVQVFARKSDGLEMPLQVTVRRTDRKTPEVVATEWKGIALELARHLRNTEKKSPTKWGREGIDLLGRVRELDPEAYDEKVK